MPAGPYPDGVSDKDGTKKPRRGPLARITNAAASVVPVNTIVESVDVDAVAAEIRRIKHPLVPAVNGKFIRGVNSVTLSASTGTAGSFGVTATRPRAAMSVPIANKVEVFDWAQLGFPEIPNNSCLAGMLLSTATSSGTIKGHGKIIHG